jgi:UDP-glucose:(heptosyl)LPS alpha-1,3-glucosyltransferase
MPHEEKLKIGVLIKRFVSTGGAERYALEITRRLALQHEVHVFAQEWAFQGPENILFHKIPKFVTKPSWLNQILFSYSCSKAIGNTFDIVHSHEKVTQFDVMTIHSPCFRSSITQEKRWWKRMLIWSAVAFSPRKMAWLWLEKKQFSSTGRKRLFVAVSGNVKRDAQANYPLPEDCFHLAYPGASRDMRNTGHASMNLKQMRAKLGISEDELVILFVGTEFKRKGLDALLNGFALIPHSRTKLVVAGGGGGKIKRYMQLAEKLGLSEHVLFLGLVENVEALYAISDAMILPTLLDPWAMAPIEAMLCGLPAAMSSSEYCGAAEYIRGGEALIIGNPRDPREIAETLSKLMDKDLRAELGRKGQALAEELTWDRTAASTLSAYQEVLRRKRLEQLL